MVCEGKGMAYEGDEKGVVQVMMGWFGKVKGCCEGDGGMCVKVK